MPQINAAGIYDKSEAGFSRFQSDSRKRTLLFSGNSVDATIEYLKKDGDGNFTAFSNGAVTELPTEITVNVNAEIRLNVSGTPDFHVEISGVSE